MKSEIVYMLGIVATGFVVNFGLRALPFILFAGRDRNLPRWLETIGRFISPMIIGGLIVYSYSGMEWRTIYPYLAGIITVGLQLWKANPLTSIIVGTVVYMCFLNCGCVTSRTIELDAQHPAVRISVQGVLFGDTYVSPEEVSNILEDYGIPHDRVIHIRLDKDVVDLRTARYTMACISQGGYRRSVLVTERHGESINCGEKKSKSIQSSMQTQKPKRKTYGTR